MTANDNLAFVNEKAGQEGRAGTPLPAAARTGVRTLPCPPRGATPARNGVRALPAAGRSKSTFVTGNVTGKALASA